jgi:hypothetical protein
MKLQSIVTAKVPPLLMTGIRLRRLKALKSKPWRHQREQVFSQNSPYRLRLRQCDEEFTLQF